MNDTPCECTPDSMIDALENSRQNGEKRGRKPAAPVAPATPAELPPALMQQVAQETNLVRQAQDAVSTQSIMLAEVTGRMQAFGFVHSVAKVGHIKLLAEVKEQKAYRGATVRNPQGELITINTFEEYCNAIGISRRTADENIQNLYLFGEEFLESAQKLGLGYRQIRQLRTLPEEERIIMIESEAIKTNDPEAMKDWVEELVARHTRLKEELKNKDADLAARDKVLATKSKALDDVHTQLAKIKNLDVDATQVLDAQKQKEALALVADKAGLALEGMVQFFATLNAALEMPKLAPQMREHMEGAANAVGASLADMFATRLDWQVDFAGMVYPEWMQQQAAAATADNTAE